MADTDAAEQAYAAARQAFSGHEQTARQDFAFMRPHSAHLTALPSKLRSRHHLTSLCVNTAAIANLAPLPGMTGPIILFWKVSRGNAR